MRAWPSYSVEYFEQVGEIRRQQPRHGKFQPVRCPILENGRNQERGGTYDETRTQLYGTCGQTVHDRRRQLSGFSRAPAAEVLELGMDGDHAQLVWRWRFDGAEMCGAAG